MEPTRIRETEQLRRTEIASPHRSRGTNEPHRERRFHLSDIHSGSIARDSISQPSPPPGRGRTWIRARKWRNSGLLAQGRPGNRSTILSQGKRALNVLPPPPPPLARAHLRFTMRTNAENDRVRFSSDRHANDCQADGIPYQPNGDIALAAADAPRSLTAVVATLIVRQKRYQAGARPRTSDAPPVTAQAAPIPLPKANFHLFRVYRAAIAVTSDASPSGFAAGRSAAERKRNRRASSGLFELKLFQFFLFFFSLAQNIDRIDFLARAVERACNICPRVWRRMRVDGVNIFLGTIGHTCNDFSLVNTRCIRKRTGISLAIYWRHQGPCRECLVHS